MGNCANGIFVTLAQLKESLNEHRMRTFQTNTSVMSAKRTGWLSSHKDNWQIFGSQGF